MPCARAGSGWLLVSPMTSFPTEKESRLSYPENASTVADQLLKSSAVHRGFGINYDSQRCSALTDIGESHRLHAVERGR